MIAALPSPDDAPRKRTPKRATGDAARESAFANLDAWRHRDIRRFQHRALDHLLAHGELFAPDLADDFEPSAPVRKVFIGAAMGQLSRCRLIRKTGAPRYTTQCGRHGNYSEVWALAVDAATVAEWKRTHPVPPAPEAGTGDAA